MDKKADRVCHAVVFFACVLRKPTGRFHAGLVTAMETIRAVLDR
jgi:hypothetical protein